ncbi:MAG TPA: glutathione S-transferase family protein [Kofleriaceae bacterium]|jgi:glutathione S-transferase
MSITLYHHPFSRAAGMLWALEEVGVPYELHHVDILKGEQKQPLNADKNPMGKLPTLVDGDTVVTEGAAICLYLGDRYSYGTLAPKHDDAARGTYYRWSFFAPSVIEPAAITKLSKWDAKPGQVGWGDYDSMVATCESAIAGKQYVLGDNFSMADIVFGGCLRFMLRFKMMEPKPVFADYVSRLEQRPALQRGDAKNNEIIAAKGLDKK